MTCSNNNTAASSFRVESQSPASTVHRGSTRGPQGVHRGSTRGPQGVHRGPQGSAEGGGSTKLLLRAGLGPVLKEENEGGPQGVHRGSTGGSIGGPQGEGGERTSFYEQVLGQYLRKLTRKGSTGGPQGVHREGTNLFLRAGLGPVLEEAADDLLGQRRVLLEELDDAVGQLGVVQRQALDLVQRQQHLCNVHQSKDRVSREPMETRERERRLQA